MTDKDNAWKLVPLERSYDMRARAILAFNTATANGADRDDALQAAWEAEYHAAPANRQKDNDSAAGPINGFWRDADWLLCRDGKWRPVEPGTFPLAHGAPARVGRLRAYGNAINAEAARVFIESVMECLPC